MTVRMEEDEPVIDRGPPAAHGVGRGPRALACDGGWRGASRAPPDVSLRPDSGSPQPE
ncbi:protein of unknown function [Azospirillum baldaniorum]|uniref:Uncharacterized protein n=1 Tax=Azospirillum baldaniorum TaxID=1064539 RepID=A0A9P1JPJ1_9PROT|nr:protein of unknown function [Azospirillum baldaniorum]